MKKLFSILAVAALAASCCGNANKAKAAAEGTETKAETCCQAEAGDCCQKECTDSTATCCQAEAAAEKAAE